MSRIFPKLGKVWCVDCITPKGIMSDANARANNVGGEVLCTVF